MQSLLSVPLKNMTARVCFGTIGTSMSHVTAVGRHQRVSQLFLSMALISASLLALAWCVPGLKG